MVLTNRHTITSEHWRSPAEPGRAGCFVLWNVSTRDVAGSILESKHPIYELEILPLVVAVKIWAKFIFKKLVVHYLDNDAARSAFIRANASTTLGSTLIAEYIHFEYKCRFSPWFARVASHSNPSDQPSRLDFTAPWIQHVQRVDVVLPAHLSEWGNNGCADT